MPTHEENELMCRIGPGNPCGDLMRRYWQPAALSEELPMGGAPLAVRLLGEDLVLFRDPSTGSGQAGQPGLLGIHCSHRGADLSYGRLEDGGLRCVYHGWLYDRAGRCLEQPGEPAGSMFHEKIRHTSYPCEERAGIVFAYMGPGEPPLFPNYDFLSVPLDQVFAVKIYHECNFLQANEGNIDMMHASFLHYSKRPYASEAELGVRPHSQGMSSQGAFPHSEWTEAEITDYGVRICKIRRHGEERYLRVGNFIMPSLTAVPGNQGGHGGYSINWHVPIDDTHHWKYTIIFNHEQALSKEAMQRERAELNPDYTAVRNRVNRYMQDRASMSTESYSGIGFAFQTQDLCVVEGAGPIYDRTQEHMVPSSDAAIVFERKLLLKAIQDVQKGLDPLGVVRDPAANRFPSMYAYSCVIRAEDSWQDHLHAIDDQRALAMVG